jgi:predicted exporter
MQRLRRLAPVWLWLVAMALCTVLVVRATYTADLSAFLPQAPTPEQQLLVNQLRDGLVSRLILVGIEGSDAPTHAALSRMLVNQLRGHPLFVAASNGDGSGQQRDQAFLFEHRYHLSGAVDAQRFSVDGLRHGIQDTLDLLASPAGLLVKDLLPRDPTGEMAVLIEQLGTQSATAQNRPNMVDGVWASRDGQRSVLLLQTRAAGSDTDGQQAAVAAVQSAFAQALSQQRANQTISTPTARLVLAGPGVFGVQVRDLIKSEVTRLSLAGSCLIIVLLLALYRSVPALVLGLLPVASGVLVAVATVSFGFGAVHGLTLGFGTTLIGEAVDYSIYLFVQSRHADASGDNWVKHFWPTVRLGVFTSIFGFAALLFSGFPGLAQLGLYSIAGLSTAALVTRYVLPHLLPAHFSVRDISAPGMLLSRALAHAKALRYPALGAILVSLCVLVMHRDALWNHDLSALSPVSARDQALDQKLRADLGAPDVRYLVLVSGQTQEEVLVAAEQVTQSLQSLIEQNLVGGVDSPSHLLPSVATQKLRLAAIPPSPVLQQRLGQALQGLPLQADKLRVFIQDVEKARAAQPVQRADLEGSTLAVAVDGMLLRRTGGTVDQWSAVLPLHAPRSVAGVSTTSVAVIDPARIKAAWPSLMARAPGKPVFVDLKGEADALYTGYLREAAVLSLTGLVAISLLVAVALRSPRRMFRVMLPLVGTVVIVMAALALAGQRLTLLHLVGLLLTVAVGSNYALFFDAQPLEPNRSGRALTISPTTLASLMFANITSVVGFGILGLSSVPILQAIGVTVGPGVVLALFLAAVFAAPQKSGVSA